MSAHLPTVTCSYAELSLQLCPDLSAVARADTTKSSQSLVRNLYSHGEKSRVVTGSYVQFHADGRAITLRLARTYAQLRGVKPAVTPRCARSCTRGSPQLYWQLREVTPSWALSNFQMGAQLSAQLRSYKSEVTRNYTQLRAVTCS